MMPARTSAPWWRHRSHTIYKTYPGKSRDFARATAARACHNPRVHSSPIDWASWRAEIHATLLFIIRDGEILLMEKKRGLGAGKINGPGGKIDPGETPLECAVRETEEELGITALRPVKMGELHFAMSDVPDILCHVFLARDFKGRPVETEEAKPLWCRLGDIPYDRMWSDDVFWLPLLLDGRTFHGRFVFSGEEEILWQDLQADVYFSAAG